MYVIGEPFPSITSVLVSFHPHKVMSRYDRFYPRHEHESRIVLWLDEGLLPQIKAQMPNVVQVTTKPSSARIRNAINEHGF